jgi:hypothetical protein
MRYHRINHRASKTDRPKSGSEARRLLLSDRETRAEHILARALETVGTEQWEPGDLALVRTKVEARAAQQTRKENTIMARIISTLRAHPRLSFSLAAAVGVFLFVTLVPFSYTTTVGYNVVLSEVDGSALIPPAHLKSTLSALGYQETAINCDGMGSSVQYTIAGLPTRQAAREAVAAFSSLSGSAPKAEIKPIRKTVSGSLYAQVRDRFFLVEVDATGKSDAEIAAEVTAKLQAQGLDDVNVSTVSHEDGTREITIEYEGELEPATGEDEATFEFHFRDSQ